MTASLILNPGFIWCRESVNIAICNVGYRTLHVFKKYKKKYYEHKYIWLLCNETRNVLVY